MITLLNKEKIRADDYITGFLILSYLIFALFFRLETIMSIIIYPLVALFFYGIIKIIGKDKSLNKVLIGIISIFFSMALLGFLIDQPNVSIQNVITLAAFPIIIVGIAGIVKGVIITIYSDKYRVINIIIGAITILVGILVLISSGILPSVFILFHIMTLSIAILINVVSRAALYLSEFGLKIFPISNFRVFFYIISDYLIYVNNEGNIVLGKITLMP
ncbi:MAG: hypothetical protein ACW98X_23690 [Promethearchaeota archaeon]|jgi:hypothetical protein